jgi:hypothetical protein
MCLRDILHFVVFGSPFGRAPKRFHTSTVRHVLICNLGFDVFVGGGWVRGLGFATFGEPLMMSVKRNWDGSACSPSHRAKAWCCIDSGSGSLVLGVEATYSDDPRPRASPGPTIDLDSYETVAFYLATQAQASRSDVAVDAIEYLQVVMGPHGHYMVQKLQGHRVVSLSCLSHQELMTQHWYSSLLPRQRVSATCTSLGCSGLSLMLLDPICRRACEPTSGCARRQSATTSQSGRASLSFHESLYRKVSVILRVLDQQ